MSRPRATPRKRGLFRTTLTILLALPILYMCRPVLSNKRCTPTSREAYCPQPMQCVDSMSDQHNPRPLIVIAAGGQRAASTFLYNALRILLRIRDPNTVSGWYKDLQHLYNSYAQVMPRNNNTIKEVSQGNRLLAFQSVGSILVKIHTVRDWHEFLGGGDVEPSMDAVDAVYTSHRDIRHAVRSIRDMGWGVSHTDSQMAEKDFCRKKRKKKRELRFFRPGDYAREDTWVSVARTQLLCRDVLLETAGSKLSMDLKAEDIVHMEHSEMVALLREMSRDLDYDYSGAELEAAVKELRRLRPSACDNGFEVEMSLNPVTHLHKGHVRQGDEKDASSGMEAIVNDVVCRRWLKQHMYDVNEVQSL